MKIKFIQYYLKFENHWNQEPYLLEKGINSSDSILEKCFNAPAAQIPCGQLSDNAHLKDENYELLICLN